jgi:cytochrome c peroxidase
MKLRKIRVAALVFALACVLPVFFLDTETVSGTDEYITTGIANPVRLVNAYNQWEARYTSQGGDRNLILPLNWSKGLSDERIKAGGYAKLNLIDGTVMVEVSGLPDAESYDFWIIDDKAEPGRSILPEASDTMMRVGTLKREGKHARLEVNLGSEAFTNFKPDLIVLTKSGESPEESRLLVGHRSLFNALYWSKMRGQFGVLDDSPTQTVAEKRGLLDRVAEFLSPDVQAGGAPAPFQSLVTQGRNIFFNEVFDGNGRTCGTCHREDNNLTIDPTFISTLAPNDPLFVAEFNPNLAQNFEKPVLMRQVGLILENLDGFDSLSNKFVMRGVPHTLALSTSIGASPSVPGFADATGWSGDGAPTNDTFPLPDGTNLQATGDLRDFAIGAVRQHFPKTLARRPVGGIQPRDFRFPTSNELDALEAFQLSTGRQSDLTLPLTLKGALAQLGQTMFMTNPNNSQNISCNTCHFNAGAIFLGGGVDQGTNANRDTNVEELPNQPGRLIDPTIPVDGGFGGAQVGACPPQGCGNGQFNIAPVVEAADTGPFFHNNAINTVEGSVQFYNFGIPAQFNLSPSQVQAIAAFMRVINALENLRSAVDLENRALLEPTQAGAAELLKLSVAELDDAISVLSGASLHPNAVRALRAALAKDQQAINTANKNDRDQIINQALLDKQVAEGDLAQ